mmetsp:Transcript_7471/g.6798  ORF Transcript_7471/g.6798 Transcript_7471/m.6798 type:complete len:97 (+) Transcript_7471:307-597(+)
MLKHLTKGQDLSVKTIGDHVYVILKFPKMEKMIKTQLKMINKLGAGEIVNEQYNEFNITGESLQDFNDIKGLIEGNEPFSIALLRSLKLAVTMSID